MIRHLLPLALLVSLAAVAAEGEAFPFLIRGVRPDSVANASYLNHKPAGKFGFLHNHKGDFTFASGETIRWFGLNLVASRAYPRSHAEADVTAAKWAGLGVNIVRIHHLTPNWQTEAPFYAEPGKSTLRFNEQTLERLDYFLAALGREGIYVTNEMIDSSLDPAPGEIPYTEKLPPHSLKVLMLFDPAVQAYVKEWVKAFYCRPNRYTGKTLFEDPQLAVLGIVNEVSIGYHSGKLKTTLPPRGRELLEEQFKAYLNVQKLPEQPFDIELRERVSVEFWDQLMKSAFANWRDYLRSLGYRGMVSGSNFGENFFHHGSSTEMDFMDAHLYWGFAGYMDGVDKGVRILPGDRWSDLIKPPRNNGWYTKELFARFSMSSLPDKPLVSSEHRSSITNFQRSAYRAAGLPFFATQHAFQEWDGFYIFASQGGYTERIGHRLDVDFDTTYLATFPLASYLLRGNVIAPARETVLYEATPDDVFSQPRGLSFFHDGLFNTPEQHKVRILYPWMKEKGKFTRALPFAEAQKLPLPKELPPVIAADTGEFSRNWEEGYFQVDTPKVQGVEGFFDRTKHFEFKDLTLAPDVPFGVFFVSAGAANSLAEAPRLLFTAVNTCHNAGDYAAAAKGWSLPGTPPVVVEPVKGKIRFKAGRFTVWPLGEYGERAERPAATDIAEFTFDTGRDRTVWYEFERTK